MYFSTHPGTLKTTHGNPVKKTSKVACSQGGFPKFRQKKVPTFKSGLMYNSAVFVFTFNVFHFERTIFTLVHFFLLDFQVQCQNVKAVFVFECKTANVSPVEGKNNEKTKWL